jgi:hypothetical protein
MMKKKIADFIEESLDKISDLSTLDKFDLLFSVSNALMLNMIFEIEIVKNVLIKIEALRYEMAYNKGIEAISSRLDMVLAFEALTLAKTIFTGKELEKYIKDILYYEKNEGLIERYKQELENL